MNSYCVKCMRETEHLERPNGSWRCIVCGQEHRMIGVLDLSKDSKRVEDFK